MPESVPELNISDIRNLLLIVDGAAKRGAFSAKEFAAIGEVYARVDAFVTSHMPPQDAPEKTEEA